MAVFPSLLDYHRRAALLFVALSQSKLSFAECMRRGSDLWVHCRTLALVMQATAFEATQVEFGQYLDALSGARLERYVFDRYGIQKQPAAPSTGTLAVWRAVAPTEDVEIPAGSRILTNSRVIVQTLLDVTLPAGSTAKQTVPGQSSLAASGQNVAAGLVTGFEAPVDDNVRASNATADGGTEFAGSGDAETDDAYRERARMYWRTQRRATLEALELGALEVDGVSQATAFEVLQWDGTYGGAAYLNVADAAGESSTAMEDAVKANLESWRAAGIVVGVQGGVPQYVPVGLNLTILSGFDQTAIRLYILQALVALGKRQAPGATLAVDDIRETVHGVLGVKKQDDTVTYPIGDTVPTLTNGVLRIRKEDIAFL